MAESYVFSLVLEPQEEGGFTVLAPALPQVVTEGDTEEAIRAVPDCRRERGIAIPGDSRPEIRRIVIAA